MTPFWALETPSAEVIYAKDTQGLWATAVLPFVASSAEGSLQLPVQSAVGIPPVTLGTEMDPAPTRLNGIRVHSALLSTKATCSCGSDGPGHQSTQSWRADCLFPPLSWGQNPSSPGHSTHCSLLINMNWRFLQGDQSNISPSILFENLPT